MGRIKIAPGGKRHGDPLQLHKADKSMSAILSLQLITLEIRKEFVYKSIRWAVLLWTNSFITSSAVTKIYETELDCIQIKCIKIFLSE